MVHFSITPCSKRVVDAIHSQRLQEFHEDRDRICRVLCGKTDYSGGYPTKRELAAKQTWIGEVEATTEAEAIQKAAKEFKRGEADSVEAMTRRKGEITLC